MSPKRNGDKWATEVWMDRVLADALERKQQTMSEKRERRVLIPGRGVMPKKSWRRLPVCPNCGYARAAHEVEEFEDENGGGATIVQVVCPL